MNILKLNAVEANPVHELAISVARSVDIYQDAIGEVLHVLNCSLDEEQDRRKLVNESEYCVQLPSLAYVDAERREDCAIELLPEYMGSIWWLFPDDCWDPEENLELTEYGYLEPDSNGYTRELFRRVIKDAHDWEIDLLMEYEALVKEIRYGLEALDEGIAALSRSCVAVSSQSAVKLPQRVEAG